MSELSELVRRALAEDIGDGDVTSEACVRAGARGRATVTQKQAGGIFGVEPALLAFRELDPSMTVLEEAREGVWREAASVVLVLEGDARALLAGERTALNFLARLSAIAMWFSLIRIAS